MMEKKEGKTEVGERQREEMGMGERRTREERKEDGGGSRGE